MLCVNTESHNGKSAKKNGVNAILAYVCQLPQTHFCIAFAQQPSKIWQPSILQMALLFLLRTLWLL